MALEVAGTSSLWILFSDLILLPFSFNFFFFLDSFLIPL